MGVLTTKLTPENEEPRSVLIITNMINNSETTWGKKHFSQSSKPIEVMSKKGKRVSDWKNVLTSQDQDIPQCSVLRKKNRSHPGSFGSHSWGSTDETRNSISCSAHKRGLSKGGVLPFSRGEQLQGELTLHPYLSLWEQKSLSLDMIY